MNALDWKWLRWAALFMAGSIATWFAAAKMRETFDDSQLAAAEAQLVVREQAELLAVLAPPVVDGGQGADAEPPRAHP